jgi:hypothetical protein
VPDLRRRIEATADAHGAHATLIEETDIGRAILQEMRLHSHVRPILCKRGVEALLPARVMDVLGELGARELRATLWIALTTTRRAAAIGG